MQRTRLAISGLAVAAVFASAALDPGPAAAQSSADAAPAAQPASAEGRASDEFDPVTFFVLGNLEYVLLHELAHMIIRDLDIPVIGPEENAADYIATATLIRADLFDATRVERAREFLLATAEGLATSWRNTVQSGEQVNYWDTHALSIQRYYQMICLIYGSNPQAFADLPARVQMPEARAVRCPAEFARAERSLQWLLANYGRSPEDPVIDQVTIVYESPPTRTSDRMLTAIRRSGIMDNTARRLQESFALPAPMQIIFRQCGGRQAVWFPEERELIVCYELLDAYYAMGLARGVDRPSE